MTHPQDTQGIHYAPTNIGIPFALSKDGRMVSVNEVKSGLACDCVCAECGEKLVARKGRVRVAHFAHYANDTLVPCRNGAETALHLMAKQIIADEKCITVPRLTVSGTWRDEFNHENLEEVEVTAQKLQHFDSVELEKPLHGFIPDVIGYVDGKPFVIEVVVTNPCKEAKIHKIRGCDISAIEIDLGKLLGAGPVPSDIEALKKRMLGSVHRTTWLHHSEKASAQRCLNADLKRRGEDAEEKRQRRLQALAPAKKSPARSSPLIAPLEPPTYDPRWLLCESCRNIFSRSQREVPYSVRSTPCPACKEEVSTGYPWVNFRL